MRERGFRTMFVCMKKIPRFWVAGTLVALAGVVVARFVAPELESVGADVAVGAKVLGHLIAFLGIVLIARGIAGKRAESEE